MRTSVCASRKLSEFDDMHVFDDSIYQLQPEGYGIDLSYEYQIHRLRIYDRDGKKMGEVDFIVPAQWFDDFWDEHRDEFYTHADTVEEFLDHYVPEEDGVMIYQEAIKADVIKEEFITPL